MNQVTQMQQSRQYHNFLFCVGFMRIHLLRIGYVIEVNNVNDCYVITLYLTISFSAVYDKNMDA